MKSYGSVVEMLKHLSGESTAAWAERCFELQKELAAAKDVIQDIYDNHGVADLRWILEECPWLEEEND